MNDLTTILPEIKFSMQKKPKKETEIPPLTIPEQEPIIDPEEPLIPEEDPDVIPEEEPYETPPYELPPPGEGP